MVYIVFFEEMDHTSLLIVVRRSAKMKTLWILLVLIGLSLSEKLDRTYLPPPGAKFSGGSPGDIDVPLELPIETYPSRSGNNNFGRPEIAIGIDRVGPNRSSEKYGDITPTVPSFQGNSFSFPTTTTSYAFSQSTSHSPEEISVNSKYANSISINNSTPGYLREKYLNFDHNKADNVYNTLQNNQVLNDDTNSFDNFENQLSDNEINSQVVKKISDEGAHFNNGDIIKIPEIHSPSGDLGIQGITSFPTIVNNSLINNSYDTYNTSPPSDLISQKDVNFSSSTPIPKNVYSETLSKSPLSRTNTPYAYRTLPERIQSQDREAVILNYENTITPDGYAYSFDTSNGIHADEKGTTINGVQAVGSYSYIGNDGELYSVSYTADENGFRPHGAHLPTAPPIPDAILKVIEQAALDKANGVYDDGSYDENKYGYRKYNLPKNIQKFPNPYKEGTESANLNRNISNNQLPQHTRFDENLNKNNEINLNAKVQENEQNVRPKDKLQPFMKNNLINVSLSEISPNYKSKHFEHIEKDDEDSNNGNDNNLQNNVLNSLPNLDDRGKDNIMSNEVYDETGYHYNRPQNHYSVKAEDNVINRFSETPASNIIPAMYKKIKNTSARPFMTPYVSRNDDISIKHDQSLDIPAQYHEQDAILSNQRTNPNFSEMKMILGKTETGNIHDNNFNPVPSTSNDNNDSIVSYITSTENGISDITSTLPTAFPSRFNIIESNSQNPSKHSGTSLFPNQDALPSQDQEDKEAFIHSNKLDSYGNHYNDDNNAGSRYNTPAIYEADKDYTIVHSTTKTYNGEDFSGPKRMQAYDPLTGYHY